jgi:tetratricopeptide (TPR) repeat protein
MSTPDLQQIKSAVANDPGNAELRYLLGAELAQQRDYDGAVIEMSTALAIDPNLHFARLQLGLLYLTMARPNESVAIWAPLEKLDDDAALKAFKRGLEALIRDDFAACIEYLQLGIRLNSQNAPLNRDMTMIIDRVRETTAAAPAPVAPHVQPAVVPPSQPSAQTPSERVRTDFSLYGDPGDTKH